MIKNATVQLPIVQVVKIMKASLQPNALLRRPKSAHLAREVPHADEDESDSDADAFPARAGWRQPALDSSEDDEQPGPSQESPARARKNPARARESPARAGVHRRCTR